MIFYYAITNYHILNCILHKFKYHKKEKAILYISIWHPEHKDIIAKIQKMNFFDEVLAFKELKFPSGNNYISKEQIKKDIKYINDNMLNFNLSSYKEINVCGDHYCLGVYLVTNNIKYNYFEDGCGILSNEDLLMNNIKQIEYSRYQILKSLKIPGKAKCIKNRFGNLQKQFSNYKNIKDINFSVSDELKKISKKDLEMIFSIFCENYKITTFEDAALILTFHYNNLGILTLEEQKLFYGYLIDYFANNKKVIIKPHPSDSQPNYNEWFPQTHVLPRKMPSEFLPFFVQKKFPIAITGWSTSIYNLSDILENVINFNQEIDKTYWQMNQYYLISYAINKISQNNKIAIYTNKINCKQLKNTMNLFEIKDLKIEEYIETQKNQTEISNIIISNIDKKSVQKDIIYNLINKISDNDLVICTIEKNITFEELLELLVENSIVLEINKEKITPTAKISKEFLKSEYLICFTKNSNFRNIITKIKLEKELTYSNIKIKVKNNFYEIFGQKYIEQILKNKEIEKKYKQQLEISKDFEQQIFDKNHLIDYLQNQNNEILNSSSWKITKNYRKIGKYIKKILNKK